VTRPPLSVVIATRDRPEALARCLATLLPELASDDEVIVVDSASAVPPATPVGVRRLRAPRPGTSLARNLGWRAARHEVVAFLDDDVEVAAGWSDALAGAFATAGATAFVTGRIGVPARQAGVAEPTPLVIAPHPFPIERRRRGLLGAGANLAVRRDALAAVGGFDDRFGPGAWIPAGEDHELLDRLLAAGFTGRHEPAAAVDHDQWRTRRQALVQHWRMGVGGGARLARLLRHDVARAPMVARELFVDDAAAAVAGSLRAGYRTGTVLALLRLAGLLAGLVAGPLLGRPLPARLRP
jgi:GT2 family glycosyltransferase